jgi:hypothetical protein
VSSAPSSPTLGKPTRTATVGSIPCSNSALPGSPYQSHLSRHRADISQTASPPVPHRSSAQSPSMAVPQLHFAAPAAGNNSYHQSPPSPSNISARSTSQSPSPVSGSPRQSTAIKGASNKALPTATATFIKKLAEMDNLPGNQSISIIRFFHLLSFTLLLSCLDHAYLNDFLDSFRKFTTPQQLLESLQSRYAYLPPAGASASEVEEYNLWRGPVQLR